MKAKYLFGVTLICTGLFFAACQKDDLADPVNSFEQITPRNHDCSEVCIDPDDPEYQVHEDSISNNSGTNTRVFDYAVYNTLSAFELFWTYSATNGAARTLRVTVSGAGFTDSVVYISDCVQDDAVEPDDTGSYSFVFDTTWAACDVVDFTVEIMDCDSNVLSPADGTYDLVGECAACEESFSYVDNGDSTYTFTYIPETDLDSAELVFTFPQADLDEIEGLDDWTSHGQTYQTTLDLTACTEYSWTVTLLPRCRGNAPRANVWTDFKVNDESKKNEDTPNIVVDCD